MVRNPSWYLVSLRHICAIPHFATLRDNVQYPIKTSTKMFAILLLRKIRALIKIKWALSPQKTPNTPPPLKRGIFMDMVFPAERNAFFRGVHKIGAAISGPRIADTKFYGHEDFSELLKASRDMKSIAAGPLRSESFGVFHVAVGLLRN